MRFINWLKSFFAKVPAPTVTVPAIETSAARIAEASRLIVIQAMGKTAWDYDEAVISEVYDELGRSGNFERLVQLLNKESDRRKFVASIRKAA